jgi:hypothetical protein
MAEQEKQKKRPYYGGGMPKGKVTKRGLDKEAARARLRELVMQHMDGLVEAQVANAQGIKYLVARDKKTGKFRRLSEDALSVLEGETGEEREVVEVWEKDPNVSAFTDLLNRTIDKPIEQVNVDAHVEGVYRWKGE